MKVAGHKEIRDKVIKGRQLVLKYINIIKQNFLNAYEICPEMCVKVAALRRIHWEISHVESNQLK